MIFSAWEDLDEPNAFTFIPGDELTENHLAINPRLRLVKTFEADSWEEAVQQYYDWKGWGEYRPIPESDPST